MFNHIKRCSTVHLCFHGFPHLQPIPIWDMHDIVCERRAPSRSCPWMYNHGYYIILYYYYTSMILPSCSRAGFAPTPGRYAPTEVRQEQCEIKYARYTSNHRSMLPQPTVFLFMERCLTLTLNPI